MLRRIGDRFAAADRQSAHGIWGAVGHVGDKGIDYVSHKLPLRAGHFHSPEFLRRDRRSLRQRDFGEGIQLSGSPLRDEVRGLRQDGDAYKGRVWGDGSESCCRFFRRGAGCLRGLRRKLFQPSDQQKSAGGLREGDWHKPCEGCGGNQRARCLRLCGRTACGGGKPQADGAAADYAGGGFRDRDAGVCGGGRRLCRLHSDFWCGKAGRRGGGCGAQEVRSA